MHFNFNKFKIQLLFFLVEISYGLGITNKDEL